MGSRSNCLSRQVPTKLRRLILHASSGVEHVHVLRDQDVRERYEDMIYGEILPDASGL